MIGDKIFIGNSVYFQTNNGGTLEKLSISGLTYWQKLKLYIRNYFRPLSPSEMRSIIKGAKR